VGFSARLSAAPAVGPVMTMYVDGEAQAWIQLTPEVVAKIQEGLIKYGYVGTGKYTVKYVMPDATTVEVRLSAAGGVGRTDSPITQP